VESTLRDGLAECDGRIHLDFESFELEERMDRGRKRSQESRSAELLGRLIAWKQTIFRYTERNNYDRYHAYSES
jgi:hypothetical protein